MMTGAKILAAAGRAHTAHPRVSPIADRNAGSSIILKEPMLVVGAGQALLDACRIPASLPDGRPDPGLIVAAAADAAAGAFVEAIAKHRHFARETDPPRV